MMKNENETSQQSHDNGASMSLKPKPTWTDLHVEAMKAEHLQTTVTNLRKKLREYDRTSSPTEENDNYFGADALNFFLNDECNLTRYLLGCKHDLHKCIKKMNKTLKFYLDYPSWVYDMIPIIVKSTTTTAIEQGSSANEEASGDPNHAHPYKVLLEKCDLYDKLQAGTGLKEFISN
jgi:hypothetical protein